MLLFANSFRGEAPRVTPRALPDNAAQVAMNARLQSGDLETWRRFAQEYVTGLGSPVRTIHKMGDHWLAWAQEVEVARGVIPGDTKRRTYITGLDKPRVTNTDLAIPGGPPYPVASRWLGVPAPQVAPAVDVTVAPPPEGNITLVNPGAELGNTAGWTITSGALQVNDASTAPPQAPQAGNYYFAGGNATSTEATQSVNLDAIGVIAGQGLRLRWWQARGADGGTAAMGLRLYSASNALLGDVMADEIAPANANEWVEREIVTQVPDGATRAELVMAYTRVGGSTIDAYIDTISLSSIDYTNSFDGSSLSGWTTSPNEGSGSFFRRLEIDSNNGRPAPCFRFSADSRVPFMYQDFSADKSPSVTVQFDMRINDDADGLNGHVVLFASQTGQGDGVGIGGRGVRIHKHSSWSSIGGAAEVIRQQRTARSWATVTLTATQTAVGVARLVVRIVDASSGDVIVDDYETEISVYGPMIGWKGQSNFSGRNFYLDNINITVAAPDPNVDEATLYTNYVYTYVNEFGEEGAPSPASVTVQRNVNATATIETPDTVPSGWADYGLVNKRIYRAATGASGTAYRFVAEIPISQGTYVDTKNDEDLGEVLESDSYDLPPDDLHSILALPNGIMVGASKNQLCFSEQNRPHAWPVEYRLTVDSDIVGLGAIDTTVIVGTQTFVYAASGTSPGTYSMSQPGVPQACTSRRSFASLPGFGVVFASPDGLMYAAGPTQVSNLTAQIFTRRQWQALDPSSIMCIAHDDVVFFFWNNGIERGCFALDMKPDGFGLVPLGFHAIAAYADPETDNLYLVLDAYAEPTDAALPAPPVAFVPDDETIYLFDAEGENPMVYRWRSKLYQLPHDEAFARFQVRAETYENLVFRAYGDGQLLHAEVIDSEEVRMLPLRDTYTRFEWEVVGTDRVQVVQVADDVMELV